MPTPKIKAAFQVSQTIDEFLIEGNGYTLQISRHFPEMTLFLGKRQVATLNLTSALDTVEAFDEETTLEPPVLDQKLTGFAVVTWKGSSRLWAEKRIELHAGDDGFSYGYSVVGEGVLDRAHFWRSCLKGAPAHSVQLFNPEPNSRMVRYSGEVCPSDSECIICYCKEGESIQPNFMTISVGRDKNYHGGNWLFTPAPFCYAIEGEDNWLSLGIAAQPGEWNFSDYCYPGDGFGFSLIYDGHKPVMGSWQSPRMLCLVAQNEYAAIERYCDALRLLSLTPDHERGPVQDWWREPIFCGWGEQVSQEVHQGGLKAPDRATQANYQNWLHILEEQQINPGIVVLDDKWQLHYGLNEVDPAKWPDLPAFIAQQHRTGRRVLLWLKAWDPEGVPPEECILDEMGVPVAVDPGNSQYQKRFSAQVYSMLQANKAPLNDPKFRKVIAYAIDKKNIVESAWSGFATSNPNPMPVGVAGWDSSTTGYAFDPAKAKTMLKDLGYTPGSDGILQKDGKPLSLVLTTYGGSAVGKRITEIVQANLKDVGIDIKVQIMELSALLKALQKGDFDIDLMRWTWPDPTILSLLFKSPGWTTQYSDKDLDAILSKADATLEPAQRLVIVKELQKQILDRAVIVPIATDWIQNAVQKKVQGFKWDAIGYVVYNDLWIAS